MLRASLFRLIFRPPTSTTYDLGKRHIDALLLLLTAPLTPARVLVLHDDLVGVKVALWCSGKNGNTFSSFVCFCGC